jgi:antitoxin component YwqK of YwqJK toxin-antitoxin module
MHKALLAIFFLACQTIFAQDKQISFYEIIKDDSVVMFFNQRGEFVERKCGDYFRYVRIDDNGDFNSTFADISKGGVIRATGSYIHGKREGIFEIYYPNGRTKCHGLYKTIGQKVIGIFSMKTGCLNVL